MTGNIGIDGLNGLVLVGETAHIAAPSGTDKLFGLVAVGQRG